MYLKKVHGREFNRSPLRLCRWPYIMVGVFVWCGTILLVTSIVKYTIFSVHKKDDTDLIRTARRVGPVSACL